MHRLEISFKSRLYFVETVYMGVFNLIETFFLISLGITFLLIVLLVYHFRQRVVSLEQKNDAMFEIINNMVKEITYLKGSIAVSMRQATIRPSDYIPFLRSAPVQDISKNDANDEEDEDEDDDNETDTSSDVGNTSSDEDDEDEDEEKEEENLTKHIVEKIVVSEDDSDSEEEEEENLQPLTRIINLGKNVEIEPDEIPSLADEVERDLEDEETEETVPVTEAEDIVVSKQPSDETEEQPTVSAPNAMEVYRKMNASALKTVILQKGLRTDVGKLKKNEMLKLLEEVDE